jgi:hypothetical protein
MPHQFLQSQDFKKGPALIGPEPYATGKFVTPPWIKA